MTFPQTAVPSGDVHLLQHGVLHGLQGGYLLHHGLLHGLQGNLCFTTWSTTSSALFSHLGALTDAFHNILLALSACLVFFTLS